MSRLAYQPALDGIRGLAVGAVLLFHAGALRGGWLGVDLFFVLSGYLITSLLLEEYASNGALDLRAFWGRRARRLLPALLLVLIGVAAYGLWVGAPEQRASTARDGLATLLYVANWHAIFAGHDYWAVFLDPSPLDHTWSLAIEEQFYLLWPPVAWALLARSAGSARVLTLAALAGALASALWMAWIFDPSEGTARVYYGTDTRIFAPLLGAAVACALRERVARHGAAADRIAGVTMLGLAVSWAVIPGDSPWLYRGGLLALDTLAALAVAAVALGRTGFVARGLSASPLRWLGRISYGAYLWHWPLYQVLSPERTGLDGWALTAARVAVTLAVSDASFRLIERPVRVGRLAILLTGWRGAGWAVTSMGLVGALLIGVRGSGPDGRVDPAPGDSDLLLLGDSVAYNLAPSLVARGRARGLKVTHATALGCISLRSDGMRLPGNVDFPVTHCEGERGRWRERAKRRPRRVLIVEGWPGAGTVRIGERWTDACDPALASQYVDDLSGLVEAFQGFGAEVIIARLSPANVPDLKPGLRGLWGEVSDATIQRELDMRMACLNRARSRAAHRAGARLLDFGELTCPEGRCRRRVDGHVLRSDGVHFRAEGARIAADWILDHVPTRSP